MKKIDNRVNMFDLPLFSSDKEELLRLISTHLKKGQKPAYIFTPNPEQLVQASTDMTFKHMLQQADWLLPDGVGLVVASKLVALKTGQPALRERIPGVEVVSDLLQLADTNQYKVLLIGGRDYELAQLPPRNFLWTPGYLSVVSPTIEEEQALQHIVREFKPDIVFVAFGAPHQEHWIINHRALLEKNRVKIAMAVGGSFDYLTGQVTRAPQWLRSVGGEWAYRLLRQPWRAQRQTRLVTFVGMTLKELVKKN
jgi:N-acetylglucosaminyldiphosphoundecaprenol N-acetyl-beta-D-mannosaminyltransferase